MSLNMCTYVHVQVYVHAKCVCVGVGVQIRACVYMRVLACVFV